MSDDSGNRTRRSVLGALLVLDDGFEVTLWGNVGIYRLDHRKWRVYWTDPKNREEVFPEVEDAVARFFEVADKLDLEAALGHVPKGGR
jgi:hypothetical protein